MEVLSELDGMESESEGDSEVSVPPIAKIARPRPQRWEQFGSNNGPDNDGSPGASKTLRLGDRSFPAAFPEKDRAQLCAGCSRDRETGRCFLDHTQPVNGPCHVAEACGAKAVTRHGGQSSISTIRCDCENAENPIQSESKDVMILFM